MSVPVSVDALGAAELVVGVLVELDLPGGARRAWNGVQELTTNDQKVWGPVGEFGTVGSVEGGSAMESPGFQLGLALPGIDGATASAFAAAVAGAREMDVFGRWVTIWLQLFDRDTNAPSGLPIAVAAGVMVQVEDSWDGVSGASLRLSCEHVLTAALAGAGGWLTDSDQQARHPGDLAFELVGVIKDRTVRWPRD